MRLGHPPDRPRGHTMVYGAEAGQISTRMVDIDLCVHLRVRTYTGCLVSKWLRGRQGGSQGGCPLENYDT